MHKISTLTLKSIVAIGLSVLLSICCYAQKFSLGNKNGGFAYNTKGDCLLVVDSTKANIVLDVTPDTIKSFECYRITFRQEEDGLKPDSLLLSSERYSLSDERQKITIKNTNTNVGYFVKYISSSCDESSPCEAFTWTTLFQPISSVSWDKDTVICQDLTLYIEPELTYMTQFGAKKRVNRTLNVKYNSFLAEEGTNPKVGEVKAEYYGAESIMLDAFPYVNTPFEIEDATQPTVTQKITTDTFYTDAVVAYPSIEVASSQPHEGDEGKDTVCYFSETFSEALGKASQFRSSGPLTFNFVSNSNDNANHFEWAIVNGDYAKTGDFRNAFVLFENTVNAYKVSEPDVYCIELTVSNISNDSICEHTSYGCFSIAASALNIPNAFTPNDDGINDEFRVAYRSISTFEIYIYDQWGRRVYESNDITKGWDGKVGNRLGTIGCYFYVIKAKGTDGVSYNKKGTVNLIRSKK